MGGSLGLPRAAEGLVSRIGAEPAALPRYSLPPSPKNEEMPGSTNGVAHAVQKV